MKMAGLVEKSRIDINFSMKMAPWVEKVTGTPD